MGADESIFGHGRKAQIPSLDGHEPVYHTGYNAHFGPIYGQMTPKGHKNTARFLFQPHPHHLNSSGHIHGGVLMSLADAALGTTASHILDGRPTATISLHCDFIASGKVSDLIEIDVQLTRRTRTLIFITGTIFARRLSQAVTLLTATGIWKNLRA